MENILSVNDIVINCTSCSSDAAIKAIGQKLVNKGCVSEPYIQGMLNRDHDLSVFMGNQLAIPHGEASASQYVCKTGLAVMIYPEGIDWHGEQAKIIIGIGAKENEHMEILSNIAIKLMEEETVEYLVKCQDINEIYSILTD